MTTATIAIIGAGNMGASLLGGLINNNYSTDHLWVTDTDTNKLVLLKKQFGVQTTTDNHQAIKQADVVILAVKPNVLATVAQDIAPSIQQKKPLVISIAAGVAVASIQKGLGGKIAIVRSMPNTPALIGCGATAIFANEFVSETQHNLAETMLRTVGTVVWIEDENLMHVITSLSGSGPAYFFLVIEAMQNAAIELGLPPDAARLLTLQTAYGATRMALESENDVVELRQKVASPGGTTEQALHVLETHHLRDIFKKAITAGKKRSEELAQLFDKTTES